MSDAAAAPFQLDPRLAADTACVGNWRLCRVLLMDDARFPWLILVPRVAGAIELDDLAPDNRTTLLHEIEAAMQLLRAVAPCDKLNVGALGNIVRQLHVHVVSRRVGDAAWPGPVWGSGPAQKYSRDARDKLLGALNQAGFGDLYAPPRSMRHHDDG
jgi:diadenosine tetraphosphate (Ap4A) HIT family hydrolase